MGTFITESDVGFGTIVGSAVFNVLFVIAMCAFVAPNLTLTWWPLARDCVYYCFSIMVLVAFVADQDVSWWEAMILLFCYAGYITIMYFNDKLEVWVGHQLELSETLPATTCRSMTRKVVTNQIFEAFIYLVIFGNITLVIIESAQPPDSPYSRCTLGSSAGLDTDCTFLWINLTCSGIFILEMLLKWSAIGFWGYWKGTERERKENGKRTERRRRRE